VIAWGQVILVSISPYLATLSAALFPSMLTCDGVHVVLIIHPTRDGVAASWFACLAC
jgi:hypothetical protein